MKRNVTKIQYYSNEKFNESGEIEKCSGGVDVIDINLSFIEGNNISEWIEARMFFDALMILSQKAKSMNLMKP